MADKRLPSRRKCRCDDDTKKIVLEMVLPQIALMDSGDECESKHLFARDYWNSLPRGEQIELGHCIVCLVAQGLLPLENLGASPKSQNHVIYRKI